MKIQNHLVSFLLEALVPLAIAILAAYFVSDNSTRISVVSMGGLYSFNAVLRFIAFKAQKRFGPELSSRLNWDYFGLVALFSFLYSMFMVFMGERGAPEARDFIAVNLMLFIFAVVRWNMIIVQKK